MKTTITKDLLPLDFVASPNGGSVFQQAIEDHLRVIEQLRKSENTIRERAQGIVHALRSDGSVFWCGNGGSAADCQHLAAELVGRFRRERRGFASVALTTDTSALTAIGNDYGFQDVFRRQVEALCGPKDVVVGISTSGNSRNVCEAIHEARRIGAFTAGFTGSNGGELAEVCDVVLRAASSDTARIQEAHILAGHMLCDWVELAMKERNGRGEDADGRDTATRY